MNENSSSMYVYICMNEYGSRRKEGRRKNKASK